MTDVEFGTDVDPVREFDTIPVRTLSADDIEAIVRIDKRITGRSREDYFRLKLREVAEDSRVRVSLGAEQDGMLVGFLLARVYQGHFGVPEPTAIIDTIGVEPERGRTGIGRALYAQFARNVRALGIESIQTQADWNDWRLLSFLERTGFRPMPRVVLEARLDTP